MPRNVNGVMSLPPGNPVVPGTLIESTWANPTMSDLANEITQSLPRNGSAGMTGPLILARDGILPKEAITVDQLTATVSGNNSFLPAGAIQAFAMAAIPTGWLEANGSAISRTTYANLFTVIGTTYGAGNGTTTFNLPDLRGEFIRGWDNGRSIDPSRVFGSNQAQANQAHAHGASQAAHNHTFTTGGQSNTHTHGVNDPGHAHTYTAVQPTGSGPWGGSNVLNEAAEATSANPTGISLQNANADHTHSGTVTTAQPGVTIATEGTEGRPRNVAMIYCIKAFGALQTDGLGSMAFQNKEAVQITGGSAALTTGSVATAPVNPTDIVRLVDIGGTMTDIDCDDQQVILLDKSNPNIPVMRPQTNVPNGMVKLDPAGYVPSSVLNVTDLTYLGEWSALAGTLPTGTFVTGDWYGIDVAGTLNLNTSGGAAAVPCNVGDQIIYKTGTGWWYSPAPSVSALSASAVSVTPAGSIAATNVQAALVELDTEKAPLATTVEKTDATGAAYLPAGTTAERPGIPGEGMLRFNETTNEFEGYKAVSGWGTVGGGQMLGQAATKAIFFNSTTIDEDLTVVSGTNGGSFGPMSINSGRTVTVEPGSVWTVT